MSLPVLSLFEEGQCVDGIAPLEQSISQMTSQFIEQETTNMATPCCQAQACFVKSVGAALDADLKKFLHDKDWRNIQPKSACHGVASKKQINVESFCVKVVACFVPHAMIPGHLPVCPCCESAERVETQGSNVRWINTPKTLFGTSSHRHLDTKLHW